jgi:N-acetylglucosaminyl-diphospho-decaprenol L-rhamnosyltransferase
VEPLDLSVIIVNYNGRAVLLGCLEALGNVRDELAFEVIVVDNGSSDGSPEDAEEKYPNFRVLRAGENIGFAAACNLGLARATGRHAMLLNPDTEVLPGALKRLVDALDDHPIWGVVGPRMVDQSGSLYPAARRFPTPWRLFCEYTRLSSLLARSRLFADYYYGDRDVKTLDTVDQVEGSALVISGPAREAVGNLDPRFFLFFEEVDWCRRVWDAGFEIHLVQDAVVRHRRASIVSQYFIEARAAHAVSAMRYFHKYDGEAGLKRLQRWMTMALLIRKWGMRLAAILGAGEKARMRVEAATREQAVYRRGLPT